MPNCFQLTRKLALACGPVSLTQIDFEICKKLKVEVHPINYCQWWFDNIGFDLAMGKSFEQIKERIRTDIEKYKGKVEQDEIDYMERDLQIAEFLDENFTPNAWAEIGRR